MLTEQHPEFKTEQFALKNIWKDCKSQLVRIHKDKKKKQLDVEEAKKSDKEGYGAVPPLVKDINRLQSEASDLQRILERPYFGKIVVNHDWRA